MFLLISSSSDLGAGKGWGWETLLFHDFFFFFFFNSKLQSILLMHFSVRDELNMSLGKRRQTCQANPYQPCSCRELLLPLIFPFGMVLLHLQVLV